jgi:ankyrin repeat protein
MHAGARRTALHTAAANGHVDIVTRLVLKYAASPAMRDKNGSTPIDDAIRHRHMPVVKFLATQPIATDLSSPAYTEMYASALSVFVEHVSPTSPSSAAQLHL